VNNVPDPLLFFFFWQNVGKAILIGNPRVQFFFASAISAFVYEGKYEKEDVREPNHNEYSFIFFKYEARSQRERERERENEKVIKTIFKSNKHETARCLRKLLSKELKIITLHQKKEVYFGRIRCEHEGVGNYR
jgi:hypothetical protein